VIDQINYNIKKGKSKDILLKVIDENDQEITQAVSYTTDWVDNNFYTVEDVPNGIKINNVKMATKPLLITFSSDGCEDVVSKVYLVNKF
jgi:hypothetical protein